MATKDIIKGEQAIIEFAKKFGDKNVKKGSPNLTFLNLILGKNCFLDEEGLHFKNSRKERIQKYSKKTEKYYYTPYFNGYLWLIIKDNQPGGPVREYKHGVIFDKVVKEFLSLTPGHMNIKTAPYFRKDIGYVFCTGHYANDGTYLDKMIKARKEGNLLSFVQWLTGYFGARK